MESTTTGTLNPVTLFSMWSKESLRPVTTPSNASVRDKVSQVNQTLEIDPI